MSSHFFGRISPKRHYLRDELCSSCTVDVKFNVYPRIKCHPTRRRSKSRHLGISTPRTPSQSLNHPVDVSEIRRSPVEGTLYPIIYHVVLIHPRWLLYIAGKLWTINTKSHLKLPPGSLLPKKFSSWNPTSQLTSQVASARVMLQVSNGPAWATRGATWKMQCDCLGKQQDRRVDVETWEDF